MSEKNRIETKKMVLGSPAKHERAGTDLRADAPGFLSNAALDARQEKIGVNRRASGPVKGEDAVYAEMQAAGTEVPDVPETNFEISDIPERVDG